MRAIVVLLLDNPFQAILVGVAIVIASTGIGECSRTLTRPHAAVEMDACYTMCQHHPVRWTAAAGCECAR